MQLVVPGPERHSIQESRRKEMDINPSETRTTQGSGINEVQGLWVSRNFDRRQGSKKREYLVSVLQIAARQFANNKGMRGDISRVQQVAEKGNPPTEMINPYGRINQEHQVPPTPGAAGSGGGAAQFHPYAQGVWRFPRIQELPDPSAPAKSSL